MATKVTICNAAIRLVGHAQVIADITESNEAARICSVFYDIVRQSLLRDNSFAFSVKRVALNDTDDPVDGWSYKYAKPNKCLKPLNIVTTGSDVIEFDVEDAYILTDEANAVLRYIYDETDPNIFDSVFHEAFIYKLAATICVPLTQNEDLAHRLHTYADAIVRRARVAALNSRYTEPEAAANISDILAARV